MNYTETTIDTKVPWRATPRAADSKSGGRLSKSNVSPVGNGATNYGKLKAGTILARDSNGLLHPCGLAALADVTTAGNDVEVENAAGFFVGDTVSVRAGSNKTKSITNNSVALSIKAKVDGLSLVIAVAGTDTLLSSTYNPVNKTITVNSATSGAGAATSTHADIVGELYKYGDLIESASSATPATTCAALGTTALEHAKHGAIVSSRTISAISDTTITLSGGTFTAAVDDMLVKDGACKPVGILDETVSTTRYVDDTVVAEDRSVSVAYEGDARDSSSYLHNLPGSGLAETIIKQALGGHIYPDPTSGDDVRCDELVGFRFRDV